MKNTIKLSFEANDPTWREIRDMKSEILHGNAKSIDKYYFWLVANNILPKKKKQCL